MVDAGSLDTGYGDMMANSMSDYTPQGESGGSPASTTSAAPSESGTGGGNLAVNMDPSTNQTSMNKASATTGASSSSKKQSLGSDLKNIGNQMNTTLSAPGPAAPSITMPSSSGPMQLGGAAPSMMLGRPMMQGPSPIQTPQMVYSDQNLKTNISNTSVPDINTFINSLSSPQSFDYKDRSFGSHTEGGLMAQNLEKSNIGKSTVINTPKGKAIDTAKLTPIIASIMSYKIKELEDKMESALQSKFKGKK